MEKTIIYSGITKFYDIELNPSYIKNGKVVILILLREYA